MGLRSPRNELQFRKSNSCMDQFQVKPLPRRETKYTRSNVVNPVVCASCVALPSRVLECHERIASELSVMCDLYYLIEEMGRRPQLRPRKPDRGVRNCASCAIYTYLIDKLIRRGLTIMGTVKGRARPTQREPCAKALTRKKVQIRRVL